MLQPFLQDRLTEVIQLFKDHKVKRAFAFGSVCTADFNEKSDLDFLISFDDQLNPVDKGELWFELYYKLKAMFGRELDILTESSLRNPYFIQSLNKTKTLIYE